MAEFLTGRTFKIEFTSYQLELVNSTPISLQDFLLSVISPKVETVQKTKLNEVLAIRFETSV
jgi:hypothetical protein